MKSKILHSLIFLAITLHTSQSQAISENLYDYIFPGEKSLQSFENYFPFVVKKKFVSDEKIYFEYQAEDLDLKSEEKLSLQISVQIFGTEEEAQTFFKEISSLDEAEYFQYGNSKNSDPLGWIASPNRSFHGIFLNRNRIFQYSIFQKNLIFNTKNYQSFKKILDNNEALADWFKSTHLEILKKDAVFNQLEGDFYASKENSSQLVSWPSDSPHQKLSFDLSVDPSSANTGTILDSSGSQQSRIGDYYLYLSQGKFLELALYAPDLESSCKDSSGWHRLRHTKSIQEYEWNPIDIRFGVGGISMNLQNKKESCDLKQGIGNYPFYLGDYPLDPQTQSAVFVVKELTMTESKNSDGLAWKEYLKSLWIPEDVDWTQDHYEALLNFAQIVHKEGENLMQEEKNVTRIEFIRYLYQNYGIREDFIIQKLPFQDAPKNLSDYRYLQSAYEDKLVTENAEARPYDPITRAEAFTILARFRQYKKTKPIDFIDVPENAWYLQGASYASIRDLIDNEIFDAKKLITREDLAIIFFKLNH